MSWSGGFNFVIKAQNATCSPCAAFSIVFFTFLNGEKKGKQYLADQNIKPCARFSFDYLAL